MSNLPSRLMVLAGGTGGHVFPALAVANNMREKNTDIIWLGTRRGLEAKVVVEHNIDIEWISVEGLRGKSVLSWLLAPFKLTRALWQSGKAIYKYKPDCVLGMGGFVAGPGGIMARLLGKPLVIHEQNAVAGLTNRCLAKLANKVLTGFPNVANFSSNAEWVGNPVRQSIADVSNRNQQTQAKDGINILIVGGSQGSYSFNHYLPGLLAEYQSRINVWHQAGRDKGEELTQSYKDLGMNAKVSEFIDDMAVAYQWADLLICRAGAMTIAECCAASKPALLIPYPFSAGDHQLKNAQAVVDAGGGLMMSDQQLQSAKQLTQLGELLSAPLTLTQMGQQAHRLYKADALARVVQVCEEYLYA